MWVLFSNTVWLTTIKGNPTDSCIDFDISSTPKHSKQPGGRNDLTSCLKCGQGLFMVHHFVWVSYKSYVINKLGSTFAFVVFYFAGVATSFVCFCVFELSHFSTGSASASSRNSFQSQRPAFTWYCLLPWGSVKPNFRLFPYIF